MLDCLNNIFHTFGNKTNEGKESENWYATIVNNSKNRRETNTKKKIFQILLPVGEIMNRMYENPFSARGTIKCRVCYQWIGKRRKRFMEDKNLHFWSFAIWLSLEIIVWLLMGLLMGWFRDKGALLCMVMWDGHMSPNDVAPFSDEMISYVGKEI